MLHSLVDSAYSCEWIINCLFEENDFVYQETKDYFPKRLFSIEIQTKKKYRLIYS